MFCDIQKPQQQFDNVFGWNSFWNYGSGGIV